MERKEKNRKLADFLLTHGYAVRVISTPGEKDDFDHLEVSFDFIPDRTRHEAPELAEN
jgi:hypothetical protein